jgi:hypothetical protein
MSPANKNSFPERFPTIRAMVPIALEWLLFSLIVAFLMSLFLLSPRVPPALEAANCVQVMKLIRPVHVTINCDSYEFLFLAHSPSELLTSEHKVWQSRPLYPALGYLLAIPYRWINPLLVRLFPPRLFPSRFAGRVDKWLPEYFGYLTLNLGLLVSALLVFRRLLSSDARFRLWMLLPMSLIVVNGVTKAFFWTPHLRIGNILSPIVTLYLYTRLRILRELAVHDAIAIGLALGIAELAYGSFIITASVAALSLLVANNRAREAFAGRLSAALCLLLSFAAPVLLWVSFVYLRLGAFYSQEVAVYRQFVWLADHAR